MRLGVFLLKQKRVEAETQRKSEYSGIIQEMTSATEDANAQLELVKKATNDAKCCQKTHQLNRQLLQKSY